ncbi:MAG: beta-aspartyl-peptidase [Thermomonas sp.]|uniref:beta-aspartyl-peptidase n=1 Tax=Thermomonas sp. TaxID=1971895 RepID=UPI00260A7D46|nr:beta-aspartyl-peptidase [Thermomonas sp.]MCC7096749.1 beta-aspartyl-peptidase [Thermomonas sp.]
MTESPLLLLRNADVHAPEPLGHRHLLIGGGKVVWMGPNDPGLSPSLAATTVDLQGQRLVPGFVDAHVHASGGGGEAGHATRVPAPGLSRYTRAGVTSVVSLLGTDDLARGMPELLAHVYGLREQGLSAWAWCGGYHLPSATLTGSVRGDIALVEPIIGVGELALSDHRSSQPTLDELLRVASEAHVGGLMSGKAGVVHLHLGDGERGLDLVRRALDTSELPPRVFQPTHVNRRKALFEEAIALARGGSHVDITAFPVDEGEDAWSAEDALLRYLDSGAPPQRVSISSDGGGCLPVFDAEGRVARMDVGDSGALATTLQGLLARGLPLARALPAFTSNPATLLRLTGKGRIAVGMDADLVALGDDGLPSHVWARGVAMVAQGTVLRRGMFEH